MYDSQTYAIITIGTYEKCSRMELSFSNSLLIKLQFYMYMYVQNVHLRTYLYYKIYRHYDLKNTCMHLLWHPLRQCEVLQRQYTQTKHFWVTEIRYQMNCDIIKFCKLSIALFSHGGLNEKIKKKIKTKLKC